MNPNIVFDFIADKTNNTLNVRREFLAGRQLVWDCYTKSELLDQWFSPAPLTVKTKSFDFKEGGHWHFAMIDPDGAEYWNYIGYMVIKPIDYYTSTDAFSNEQGEINTDLPRAEWKVSFEDKGENTIVHTVVTYPSLSDLEKVVEMGVEMGLTMTLAKLDELLIKLRS